jgi:hypothetical protein
MGAWDILFWCGCAIGAPVVLYSLHRLALQLEERGHLYYLKKKPRGGGAGSFIAFQRLIEPQIQHVIHVSEESKLHGEEGGSGQGDPDRGDAATIDRDASSPSL